MTELPSRMKLTVLPASSQYENHVLCEEILGADVDFEDIWLVCGVRLSLHWNCVYNPDTCTERSSHVAVELQLSFCAEAPALRAVQVIIKGLI